MDPVWIRSSVWYQMGPLMKVIPYGTVPFQFRTSPVYTQVIRFIVDLIPNGSERVRCRVKVALNLARDLMNFGQLLDQSVC